MSIYYINLQVTHEIIEAYSSDDLFALAKQQQKQNKIVLFENKSQAESEAQVQSEEHKTSQLVCSVSVQNDPDNDDLSGTTIRASALDYRQVISTLEYIEPIIEEQNKKKDDELSIIKKQRKKFVPPRKNNKEKESKRKKFVPPRKNNKEKEAAQPQIKLNKTPKIQQAKQTFYIVLPEKNIKTDEYTENDFILLAQKQDKNILIIDKSNAIQIAKYNFSVSGTPQLIFEIITASMLGKHLELHKDFKIQGLQFITEAPALAAEKKSESPLKPQNTFTTARALYQQRNQQSTTRASVPLSNINKKKNTGLQ